MILKLLWVRNLDVVWLNASGSGSLTRPKWRWSGLQLSQGSISGGSSKLMQVVFGWTQFLLSCWTEGVKFLAMWDSPQGNSQHGPWLSSEWVSKRVRERSPRRKAQSLCDLIPEVASPNLCYILVVRNQSLGPAHTQEERYTRACILRGRDHWGYLLQTGKLASGNSSLSPLSESNSCSQDSQYSFFIGIPVLNLPIPSLFIGFFQNSVWVSAP